MKHIIYNINLIKHLCVYAKFNYPALKKVFLIFGIK